MVARGFHATFTRARARGIFRLDPEDEPPPPPLMHHPHTDAAKAIAGKAERVLAKLKPDDRKFADKRRQAAALLAIAAQFDTVHAPRAADLGSVVPTDADREAAANEVCSLATRRQSAATTLDLRAKPAPGWVKGGDDFGMPIHPGRLSEAIALFDVALSLHDESFWAYTKGLLQERLGDYTGAVRTFEQIRGSYLQYAGPHLERCRQKLAGTYDPEAAFDAAFGKLAAEVGQSGHPEKDLVRQAIGGLRAVIDESHEPQAPDEDLDNAPADADDGELDLAATIAQTFAELLVDGDFKAAHSMLTRDLKRRLKVADLEREYTGMIGQYGEEGDALPDDLEIVVMASETDLPDRSPEDVGWVYVSIGGDGFSEAISVTVTEEQDELRIRALEWGRP